MLFLFLFNDGKMVSLISWISRKGFTLLETYLTRPSPPTCGAFQWCRKKASSSHQNPGFHASYFKTPEYETNQPTNKQTNKQAGK